MMGLHALHVWSTYVMNAGFKQVHIIAHWSGGVCLRQIWEVYMDTFYQKIGKIAIIDSWVNSEKRNLTEQRNFVFHNASHFKAMLDPLVDRDTAKELAHPKDKYITGSTWPEIKEMLDTEEETKEEDKAEDLGTVPNDNDTSLDLRP